MFSSRLEERWTPNVLNLISCVRMSDEDPEMDVAVICMQSSRQSELRAEAEEEARRSSPKRLYAKRTDLQQGGLLDAGRRLLGQPAELQRGVR